MKGTNTLLLLIVSLTSLTHVDVICGRGGHVISHPGNVKFRALVEQFKAGYVQASRYAKAEITADVVRLWRTQTPPGRFLIMTYPAKGDASTWHDIGDKGAFKKVAQCLRERNPRSDHAAKTAAGPMESLSVPHPGTSTMVAHAEISQLPQIPISSDVQMSFGSFSCPLEWNQGQPQDMEVDEPLLLQLRRHDHKNPPHHQQHQHHQSKHAAPVPQKPRHRQRQHQQAQRQQQDALKKQARQVQQQVEQAEHEVWEAQQTVNQQAQHLQEALQQRTQQEAVAFATAALNQQQQQQPAMTLNQPQHAQQQAQQQVLNEAAVAAVAAAAAFGKQNILQNMLQVQQQQESMPLSQRALQEQQHQLRQQQDFQEQQQQQEQEEQRESASLSPLLWGSSPQRSTSSGNWQDSPSRRQSLSARDTTVALSMPSAANLTKNAFDDETNSSDSSTAANKMAKALYRQLESFSDTSSENNKNDDDNDDEENAGSDASAISDGSTSIARGSP